MNREDLYVGQKLLVKENWIRNSGLRNYEVVHIGRLLVTLRPEGIASDFRDKKFRIDTQHLNDKQYGTSTRFYTAQQVEAREAMKELREFFHRTEIEFSPRCQMPDEDKVKLAGFLRGMGYE
jgi:hypothetical protein